LNNFHRNINHILNSIIDYPEIITALESELAHYLVAEEMIEFDMLEIQPFQRYIHFYRFSHEKREGKWICRYYFYDWPDGISFKDQFLQKAKYDKIIFEQIQKIAKTQTTMLLINS
tara:strand:- start:2239 stop:2586 length:348 start_codon:yes stop_codon:yes gene_type:complete